MQINKKQIQYLRGLGHHLSPVVIIGQHGLSQGVIDSLSEALTRHELIKVKLAGVSGSDRQNLAEEASSKSRSRLIQVLGKTALLYRPNKDLKPEKRIQIPKK